MIRFKAMQLHFNFIKKSKTLKTFGNRDVKNEFDIKYFAKQTEFINV